MTSDFVANSCGDQELILQKIMSRESQVKKQWVINWIFWGLYVTMQIINLKTDSETLYCSLLK